MKRLKRYVLLLVTSLLIGLTFNSCQKEPSACISASKTTANVGEKITLSNCSKDAFAYEWSFPDGSKLTSENVDYTINSPGARSVSLKVFSKNGKKTDETSVSLSANATNLYYLTRKGWKIVNATVYWVENGSYYEENYYDDIDYCTKDNIDTYYSDGSFKNDEGSTKCNINDPQYYSGNWSFNSSETILTKDGSSYDIILLNETTLVLRFTYDIYTFNMTYSNQ